MQLTDQLLSVARTFANARGISMSRVSTLVFNEGKKLEAIELRGADLSTGRFEKVMAWFSENWPENAEWPASVPRPRASGDQSNSKLSSVA